MKKMEEKNCKTVEEMKAEINKALERTDAAILIHESAIDAFDELIFLKDTPWEKWCQLYSIGTGEKKKIASQLQDPEVFIFISL